MYDGPDMQSAPISKLDMNFIGKTQSISCTGTYMLVQFVTDHQWSGYGFSTKIHHTPIDPICKDWLNIATGFINSPDYPTLDCSWVIIASLGSTISIQFQVFEVKLYFSLTCFIEQHSFFVLTLFVPRLEMPF